MIHQYTDYRKFLKAVLENRTEKNTSYSLRAMARFLEVSPAQLSNVINGHKNLSVDATLKIAEKLGLNEQETAYFSTLVELEKEKHPYLKAFISERMATLRQGFTETSTPAVAAAETPRAMDAL